MVICYHATQIVEIFHILWLFLIYHNLYLERMPSNSHHLSFSTFISIPQHLPISIILSIMPCSTASSLASNTRSSAYLTVWMICPPILKSPNPSRASLVRYSLYKVNRIGNKHHPCLTPLPVFTLLVSPLPSFCLTLWSMYNLLTNLLSHQLITVTFRIYIYLVQLPWSNAFCQYMNQVHNSSSMSKVHSDIILGIPVASLFPFPLLNRNWSSPSTYSIFLSNLLLSIIATILAVCAMMLTLCW